MADEAVAADGGVQLHLEPHGLSDAGVELEGGTEQHYTHAALRLFSDTQLYGFIYSESSRAALPVSHFSPPARLSRLSAPCDPAGGVVAFGRRGDGDGADDANLGDRARKWLRAERLHSGRPPPPAARSTLGHVVAKRHSRICGRFRREVGRWRRRGVAGSSCARTAKCFAGIG